MSSVFFIAPYDSKNWENHDAGEPPKIFTIDIQKFEIELKKHWPEAKIQYAPSDYQVSIYWSLLPADSIRNLSGSIFSDYETLTIETGVEYNLAEFIVWYRQFISYEYKLYLFGDNSFERLELTDKISDINVRNFALKK